MKIYTIITLILIVASPTIAQHDIPKLKNPITAKYLKKNIRKSQPRLVYTPKLVKQVKKRVKSDPVLKNMYAAIKLNADAIYTQPLLERKLIGKRMLSTSRELLYRINMLGFVYLMQEDEKTLNRINEELIAVCNFSDWNQRHFLDVAEMALGVSLALDWTQGRLPISTIKLAKKALKEKAIEKSWPKNGKRWGIAYNKINWNQVCAGGLIAASIVLAEDQTELAAKTIHRALDGLPNALAAYGPDGVYPEGATYWTYATRYTVTTAAMFESALGSDFGHYEIPGFKESATFKVMCNAPSGWFYNYFDCADQRTSNGDETLAWFAMKSGISTYFEKDRFLQPAAEMGKLSRFSGIAMAWLVQYNEESSIEIPTAWKGHGINPVAIFKSKPSDPKQFYLGCKGGRANISHGNMDAGSFVFELNGVRWSIELGKQDYEPIERTGFNLWGNGQDVDRWKLLSKNNFGHSTITVNNQPFVYDAFVPITDFKQGNNPRVSFDLSSLYQDNIKTLKRSFTKENEGTLLIEDVIETSEKTEMIIWQMITIADVEIEDGGAILQQDGQSLKLEIVSHPQLNVSVVSMYPAPLQIDSQIKNLKRIEIRIPAWIIKEGDSTLLVRLSENKS